MNILFFAQCVNQAVANWSEIQCVQTNADTAFGAYAYYLNKYADLIETPIFVLRKKTQQVSFLHVYHHIMIVSCSYITLLVQPGECECSNLNCFFFFLAINSVKTMNFRGTFH